MKKPLTQIDLDLQVVAAPNMPHAGGLLLRPSCHNEAALAVWYREGVLLLQCTACGGVAGLIEVAPGFPGIIS